VPPPTAMNRGVNEMDFSQPKLKHYAEPSLPRGSEKTNSARGAMLDSDLWRSCIRRPALDRYQSFV